MEHPGIPGQDPEQVPQAPAAAAQPDPAAPPAPPAAPAPPQYQSAGPWAQDIQQRFQDPAVQAQVDAYMREVVQPRQTQLEQQYAETEAARQLYTAYETDAEAANVAVNRQLYGDDYANQMAASLGRTDLLTQQAAAVTQPASAPAAPTQQQAAPVPPEYQEMYQEWSEAKQQRAYDDAKSTFLAATDPQGNKVYADIKPELFDPFVAGASTWEEAVGAYRAYAANFAQNGNSNEPPPQPPPALGSTAVGAPGSTPSYPAGESLSDAIDGIFSENKPLPPPTLGTQ